MNGSRRSSLTRTTRRACFNAFGLYIPPVCIPYYDTWCERIVARLRIGSPRLSRRGGGGASSVPIYIRPRAVHLAADGSGGASGWARGVWHCLCAVRAVVLSSV